MLIPSSCIAEDICASEVATSKATLEADALSHISQQRLEINQAVQAIGSLRTSVDTYVGEASAEAAQKRLVLEQATRELALQQERPRNKSTCLQSALKP